MNENKRKRNNRNVRNNGRPASGRGNGDSEREERSYNTRRRKCDSGKDSSGREGIVPVKNEGHSNDPSDYVEDARLLEQTSKLSFQNIIGTGYIYPSIEVPSVLVIDTNPSPGLSYYYDGANVAILERNGANLAALQLYTLLSAYSGRAQSYAPQDVLTYILAAGEIIKMVEHYRRMFGCRFLFSERNANYPHRLIGAMNADADYVLSNSSMLIDRLNKIITMIDSIVFPENIKYLTNVRDFYQNVYYDDPSSMAQLELARPYSTWIVDETSYTGGTILKTEIVQSINASNPFTQLYNMVDAFLTSSTLNVIRADLVNLASKSSFPQWKLDIITDGYGIVPIYDRTWNLKLHNLVFTGIPDYATFDTSGNLPLTPNNDVYPDAGANMLVYSPAFSIPTNTAFLIMQHRTLDMDTPDPTAQDILEATRLVSMANYTHTASGTTYAVAVNTPHIYAVRAILFDNNTSSALVWTGAQVWPSSTFTAASFKNWSKWQKFANAPTLLLKDALGASANDTLIGDLNFYTDIPYEWMANVQPIYYQGLFKFRM